MTLLLTAEHAPAQAPPQPADASHAAQPQIIAARRLSPIRIDGRLDDEAWETAEVSSGFVQGQPVEGAPVDQPTEVRVLFDDDALYIGARMYDDAPETIARQMVRRDEGGAFDNFEVYLDPNLDRRTGYRFRVSASGVQGDSYLFEDTRQDNTWDAVWDSDVQIDERGWTAEMRIPLSQLRFQPSNGEQAWGINFVRRRVASNERSYFSLESRRVQRRVSVFGQLTGLRLSEPVSRIELRPYALARNLSAPAAEGNPFFTGSDQGLAGGLDLRFGLGSNFTLDATFNPDFGQVEVDPAVINLSAHETIYPEQRPFFVEDARIFDFNLSGGALFYSRRIGKEPSRTRLDDADFLDVPGETPIQAAAKLTGRTPGGLSAGFLGAVTDHVDARAHFLEGDSTARFTAEPRSQYAVARVQQELRRGESVLGGIVTAVNRSLPGDGSFDFLPSRALSAGIDWEHTWQSRAWALTGFVAGTHVSGAEDAMIRIQRSSRHYFQRPDAYRLGVDSSATFMSGLEWRLQLDRRSGRHWTGAVWAAQRTPGFEANDFGQFNGGERLDGGFRVSYQEITPGSIFRDYRFHLRTFHNWRHEALREPLSYDSWSRAYKRGMFYLSADATLLNYWELESGLRYQPARLDDELTRGGPLMARPAMWNLDFRVESDRRRPLSLRPSVSLGNDGSDEFQWTVRARVRYRPTPQVSIEMEPEYAVEPNPAQYVATTGELGFQPTYGRRYLFADLDRKTFGLATRLNVTFSPEMTLQLFAQPLLSVGDYVTYRQLARAESFDFLEFDEGAASRVDGTVLCVGGSTCRVGDRRHLDFDGNGTSDFHFEEKDFRIRSLRGNAVLRWEYRPGSTVFLVWQQRRSYQDYAAAEFELNEEFGGLLTDRPENVFILKVNYWWGM